VSVDSRSRPVQQTPEPVRLWIAYSPRTWRSCDFPWTDLAGGRLALPPRGGASSLGPTAPDPAGLDDLYYLPPVATSLRDERDRQGAAVVAHGTPLLVQLVPGEPPPALANDVESPVSIVYDLLGPLLAGEIERLALLPRGSTVVWPLVAGLTDTAEVREEGLELLVAGRAACVQPLALEVPPTARRQLVEGRDDRVFDAVFHGESASERAFAAAADRHGLAVFFPRPPTGFTSRKRNNRRIAAQLALAGDLWHRLDGAVAQGQALFRAARGAEHTHHDLVALAREDNLRVMDWLDAWSLEQVVELVRLGRLPLLDDLTREYLGRPA
jgi:hypothetical protein